MLVLMPWMKKHRIFSEERLAQAMDALSIRRMEEIEDAKALHKRFGEDVVGIAGKVGTVGTQTAAAAASPVGRASTGVHKIVDIFDV